MKRIYLAFFLCLPLLLSAQRYEKFDYNKTKNPWIDAFKDRVVFDALKEAYKRDSIFVLISKIDAFNTYDALDLEAYRVADSLGKALIKNMPPPVMCDECKPGDNYYMANAFHYYASRDLHRIALAQYRRYRKANHPDFE